MSDHNNLQGETTLLKKKVSKSIKRKAKRMTSDEMLEDWVENWKSFNSKVTDVQLSLHNVSKNQKKKFLMISQNSFKSHRPKKILIHHSILKKFIQELESLSTKLDIINEPSSPEIKDEGERLVVDEMDLDAKHSFYRRELAKVYAKLMYNT